MRGRHGTSAPVRPLGRPDNRQDDLLAGGDRPKREPVVEEYVRQGPKLAKDRLLEVMADGLYHSAFSLETSEGLGGGAWVSAIRELIERGYFFERSSMSLKMRRRWSSEGRQFLAEVVKGIDATLDEDLNDLGVVEAAVPVSEAASREPGVERVWEEASGSDDDGEGEDDDFDATSDSRRSSTKLFSGPTLNIGAGDSFRLDAAEAVTMTFGILAKKESGKTYLAMVIAEEFLKSSMPFCVLDPSGVWHGLLSFSSGDLSSYPMVPLVIGGSFGHVDLRPESGWKAAEVVVAAWPNSVVVDISKMKPDDQHAFAADFGEGLYELNSEPLHVFLEEGDEFAPQQLNPAYKNQRRSLGVWDRNARRGRLRGLGLTVITQRSAVINKNILSQINGLYVLNMMAPNDLEAVESWMSNVVPKSERSSCLRQLPRLPRGKVFYMQGDPYMFESFMVREKETLDTSRTRKMGERSSLARRLALASSDLVSKAASILAGEAAADTSEEAP